VTAFFSRVLWLRDQSVYFRWASGGSGAPSATISKNPNVRGSRFDGQSDPMRRLTSQAVTDVKSTAAADGAVESQVERITTSMFGSSAPSESEKTPGMVWWVANVGGRRQGDDGGTGLRCYRRKLNSAISLEYFWNMATRLFVNSRTTLTHSRGDVIVRSL
jgi:hypothetical protein